MSSLLQLSPEAQRKALRALVERELGARLLEFEAIDPGLGNRRFFRLHLAPGSRIAPQTSVIARVEAEEDQDKRANGVAPEPKLEPLRRFLEDAGVPVPRHYGSESLQGIELLEDIGDNSLEIAATSAPPAERQALYREACMLIPRLQRLEPVGPAPEAFNRHLDRALMKSKAERVVKWAMPWWLGRAPTAGERQVISGSFSRIAGVCEAAPARLSHRDLKAANIHLRKHAPAGDRLVLIDLQGAFLAPPEYDLVCLLRDSHVPLPMAEVTAHLKEVRPLLPDAPEPEIFMHRFTLLTLSRVAKDAAHYIYAFTNNDDSRYLRLLPAALATLREAATRAAQNDPAFDALESLIHDLRDTVTIRSGDGS